MKCLNVIIFYENPGEVEEYIAEVSALSQDVDILLVVNSDRNGAVGALLERLDRRGVRLPAVADLRENLGYLNALLRPVKELDLTPYAYVILSNTDIHYPQPDFFARLLEKKYPPDVGCVAPSVFAKKTRSYANPHYTERIPEGKLRRLSAVFSHPRLARAYLWLGSVKAGARKKEKSPSRFVYSPHGCYMIFTRSFIERIRGYEYGVKMYSEESCVGELLRRENMRCWYDADIEVIHDESSVTGKIDYRKRFSMWKDSLDYLLETFYR